MISASNNQILRVKHGQRSRFAKRQRGQGLAEVVAVLICVVPVVLLVIDAGMIAIGAGINDSACRDAARAAASGPPSMLEIGQRLVGSGKSPHDRASSVVKRIYATNLPMKLRDNIETIETVIDVPPQPAGGAVDGQVSVKTTIDVYPPFLAGAVIGPKGISLKSTHIVPITYVVPSQAP